MPRPPKSSQVSPPVFYVEKGAEEQKNYESNSNKHLHTEPNTSKESAGTTGVGTKGHSTDNTPQQGASPPENQTGTKKRGRKPTKAHAEAELPKDSAEKQGGSGDAQDSKKQRNETSQQQKQGGTKDGEGKAGSKDHEEGKGSEAPVLTEREQKLQAARERAKEVRRAKAEEKRATKEPARKTKKHTDVDDRKDAVKPVLDQTDIPQPLPAKDPPKALQEPQPVSSQIVTPQQAKFPVTDDSKTQPLQRYKKPRSRPAATLETPTEARPQPEQDSEEQELQRLRKNLEKKKLIREQMQIDKELTQHELQTKSSAMVSKGQQPAKQPAQPAEPLDQVYRQQMAQIKRSMLMDAIFGPQK